MHYSRTAFSKNGLPTIEPKDASKTIGQRNGMSPTDIAELNAVYGLVVVLLTEKAVNRKTFLMRRKGFNPLTSNS